ncbi:MAG: endonuclease/exonuclease/phosphatase family protein [Actinomycetota bacterium]|nr:endonuclease/exonuclease/phosphatase family protein [Actinomycetota bacterium]
MVRLVTEDRPDIVALQEVPLWALGRLERWSGMAIRWAVTVPALLLAPLARLVTELNAARLRSLFTGQANVLLVGPRVGLRGQRLLLLNPDVTRWEWLFGGPQQRYCQALDARLGAVHLVVANLHATNDPDRAVGEVARATELVRGAERCIFCGDFNVPHHAVADFSPPSEGIDQILVRGFEFEREPFAWAPERRRLDGHLLSDHAPVEAVLAWT